MNSESHDAGGAAPPVHTEQPQPEDDGSVVMYLEGNEAQLKQMFPFGGPTENVAYGLGCIEIKRFVNEAGEAVAGVRLALVPMAGFKPKSAVAAPPSGLIVPAH